MAAPQAVVDDLRVRLGSPSAAELPDAQLSSYLEEAIRSLSRYRPRPRSDVMSLSAGVSLYALPEGVTSIRELYVRTGGGGPRANPGPPSPIDQGVAGALAGFSPALDWPIALDSRLNQSRGAVLYGGDWYVEAGRLVVAPAPGCDQDVMFVYPSVWTWEDLCSVDGYGALTVLLPNEYEDVFLYCGWKGYSSLGNSRRKLRSVSRIGQSTTFAAGDMEAASAGDYKKRWEARVERARVGPIKG